MISYRQGDLLDHIKNSPIKTNGILFMQESPFVSGRSRWVVEIILPSPTGTSGNMRVDFILGNTNAVPHELLQSGRIIPVTVNPDDQFAYYKP